MKVLITGISGLLGKIVARDIYMAGYEVIGISRNKEKLKFDFPVNIEVLDLTQNPPSESLLSNIDIVIHCAANTQMGSFRNSYQDDLNTKAVQELIEVAIKVKVQKFIFVSTANTCLPGNKYNPGNETNSLKHSSSNLNYINTKIKAEHIVQSAVKKGLNGIIINPTFIINPLGNAKSSNRLLDYCLKKSILFYPPGGKNIVDARDVSKAIINAIANGIVGEKYIISNENYTYKEFFKLVLIEQKRRAILIPIPSSLLLFMGGFATLIEYLIKKPLNFNLNAAKILNSNHYYDYSKAAQDLDFNPRNIQDTITTKLENTEI
jgi:dihydroflavonol-4-reductase